MLRVSQLVGFNAGGEDIVRAGLQLWLDVGNGASYPGSGQSWTDLTSNGYVYYLGATNGAEASDPTYNAGPPAYFSHDGGDYFTQSAAYSGSIMRTAGRSDQEFSVEAWVYRGATANANETLFNSNGAVGAGGDGFTWYIDYTGDLQQVAADGAVKYSSSTQLATSAWKHLVLAGKHNGLVTNTFYVNAVSDGGAVYDATANWSSGDSVIAPIIGATNGTSDYFQNGTRLAVFRMYNRILTATDILQNFNAERGRFGV